MCSLIINYMLARTRGAIQAFYAFTEYFDLPSRCPYIVHLLLEILTLYMMFH